MTRIMIGLEIACLIFIAYLAQGAFRWQGTENWAIVGMLVFGGPALLVQLVAMAVSLIGISKSEMEEDEKTVPWWTSIGLALAGAGLFVAVLFPVLIA